MTNIRITTKQFKKVENRKESFLKIRQNERVIINKNPEKMDVYVKNIEGLIPTTEIFRAENTERIKIIVPTTR